MMNQKRIPALTVFGGKGGIGKTTLALNLASAFARDGLRVCLIDRDPQASSLAFARLAERHGVELPFTIAASRSQGFDLYLYDEDKNPSDFIPGDLILIPSILDGQNQLATRRTKALLEEQGKPYLVVPNRVRTDRAEQAAYLKSVYADSPMLRDRSCYSLAYARGLTLFSGMSLPHIAKAKAEFEAVYEAVKARLDAVLAQRTAEAA